MKTIEIGKEEYYLPQGWHEVSLEKFEKITKLSSLLNKYKSQTLFALDMFRILLDAPLEVVKRLSRGSYEKLSDECEWVNEEIIPTNKEKFDINGTVYIPISKLDNLTMGESIDLELMIAESNPDELLINILPLLIRKAETKLKDDEVILVPGDYDAESYKESRELFKTNLMVADVIKFQDFFLSGEK